MEYLKRRWKRMGHVIVMPIISSLIIPILLMEVWAEYYQRICFPLCKIPYVKRSEYIKIDRHKLKYLGIIQKVYCIYCGYANGVFAYWREMGARTEKYWCGVSHRKEGDFVGQEHQRDFAEYGDEEDFVRKYKT